MIDSFLHALSALPTLIVMLAFIALRAAWPSLKGALGEASVNRHVAWRLDSSLYHALHNVTLPVGRGTTQIDHVIVSIYGVFVVETKNRSGEISGGEFDPIWIQRFRSGDVYSFQNPLRQNAGHTRALGRLLGLPEWQVFSIVAFVGKNTFGTTMPANVVQGSSYIRYIQSRTEPVISESRVQDILARLGQIRLKPCAKTDREHRQYVQRLAREKQWARRR